jgi:HK97 family phage portal protein
MKTILTALKNLVNRKSEIVNTKSLASAWLRGRDDTTTPAVLASAYQQSTWVYACISTLAETVSAIPFRFVEATGSPARGPTAQQLEKVFGRPHPQLDRFQFWELIVSWLMLRGEAFVYPAMEARAMEGRATQAPNSLHILSPDHLHEIVSHGQLAGWRYSAHGLTLSPSHTPPVFLPEDLIHIRLPNPFNFFRGMSPLTVAYLAAQTDYAAAQFMKGTMLNNADTGLIITTPEQLSPEQVEQAKSALRERKRAAGTADRPLFLWGGAHVERPAISTADLQFLENRKFNRQEICAIFKVPQELLGFTEDANRSVSESARLNFMENRIAPLCKRLEAAIDPLIQRFAGGASYASPIRGEFHVKSTPIMQAAQRARVQTALRLFTLGVPVNVINQNLDLGLPDLPHGQTCYLADGLRALGQVQPAVPKALPRDPVDRCLALLPALEEQLRHRDESP